MTALAEVAGQNLPAGYTYELGGMAREEAQSSGSATGLIFILCFVFVYLLLSAQYESYILPLAVLLSVPFGLLGSTNSLWNKQCNYFAYKQCWYCYAEARFDYFFKQFIYSYD